ncbi:MAG: type II secretion system protein GspE, partial [Lysobacterales bacterium CG_4_9_14_3_um_filter_62_6]
MTEAELAVADALSAPLDEVSLEDRIATFLIARGRLKEADLLRARRLQEESPNADFISLMVRLGLVSERDAAEALSEVLQMPLLSARDCPDAPPANVQLSIRFLKQYHVVPIGEDEQELHLLVAEPQDHYPLDAVRLAVGKPVTVRVGIRSEIDDLIERYYGSGRSAMGTIVENLSEDATRSEDDVEHLRDLASEAPVIRLVNLVIQRAV